jgi:hypothetical protein
VADEAEGAVPVVSDDAVVPATWTARVPDAPWCPDSLVPQLDADFVSASAAEPACVALDHDGWSVLGASVRGRSHGHRGEHRDDALAAAARDGVMVLAVADGAGSSALSRIGAAVTAQMATEKTLSRFRADAATSDMTARLGTAMAHAVHDAAMRLHALATAAEVSPAALRTTVVLVAIVGDLMLVSQVGDGAVLIQKTDGSVVRVGATRETAWAGEVTCFVPDACAMTQAAAIRQIRAAEVSLVALLTDGVDDPFHPLEVSGSALVAQWRNGTTTPIAPARQPEIGPVLGRAAALVEWLSFEQRGEVDDRTLLLAWREPSAGA